MTGKQVRRRARSCATATASRATGRRDAGGVRWPDPAMNRLNPSYLSGTSSCAISAARWTGNVARGAILPRARTVWFTCAHARAIRLRWPHDAGDTSASTSAWCASPRPVAYAHQQVLDSLRSQNAVPDPRAAGLVLTVLELRLSDRSRRTKRSNCSQAPVSSRSLPSRRNRAWYGACSTWTTPASSRCRSP